MKRLAGLFRIQNVRNRILLNFLLLFFITTSGLLTLYSMTVNILSDLTEESVEAMLDQIHTETFKAMSHVLQTSYMIANDASIQFPLRNPIPATKELIYKQRIEYNNRLFYTNQYQESISGIYVIGDNGVIFRSTMMSLLREDFKQEEWYQKTLEEKKPLWITNQSGSIVANSLKEPYISIVIPVNDRSSTRQLGVIVIEMKGEIFDTIYRTGLMLEGEIYMLDSENNIFLYSEEQPISENRMVNIKQSTIHLDYDTTQNMTVDGEKYLISSMIIPVNNWKIVGIIPYKEILSKTKSMESSIIIVLFIFLAIMFLFMLRASNMISKPIKKMSKTMKIVESGDLNARMDVETYDEFGDLAKSFNHMLKRIDLMVKRIDILKAKEIDNQKKLRKAELKALQAQINPHFLYNTLDSIAWMARLNKIDIVEEMIEALSTYFRISISRGNDSITLREELIHVDKYLSIQKIRYDKKLNYSIRVPEEILDYMSIKMILQPLVENSIYHGLKEKEGPGEISITAVMGDNIVLCVEDTGIGMTKEKLDELYEMIASGRDYNPNAYGVINVHKRIKILFGDDYGLHYESEYGIGTKVYVTIPKTISS